MVIAIILKMSMMQYLLTQESLAGKLKKGWNGWGLL